MSRGDRSSCHRKGEAITAAIVWLLLGAIVNVAVAWFCAFAVKLDWRLQNYATGGFDHFTSWTAFLARTRQVLEQSDEELEKFSLQENPFFPYHASRWCRTGATRVHVFYSDSMNGSHG